MAKEVAQPVIDDAAHYTVRLKKVVKVGRVHLRPGEEVTLKGKVVREHLDDIAEFQPVAS